MSYKSNRDELITKTHKSYGTLIVVGLVIAIIGGQISADSNSTGAKLVGDIIDVAGIVILIDGIILGIRQSMRKNKSNSKTTSKK